jgi:hypothetical protein
MLRKFCYARHIAQAGRALRGPFLNFKIFLDFVVLFIFQKAHLLAQR